MAREHIKHLLASYDWIEVVGEAEDGARAVELSLRLKPQVLFLDVNMPVLNGFEFLEVLHQYEVYPHIIFITAHDEFAINAFDVHAVDYLLKPIVTARFAQALERLHRHHQPTSPALIAHYRQHTPLTETLTVQDEEGIVVLPIQEVVCIQATDNTIEVFTSSAHYVSKLSLNELEGMLDERRFTRIHRSVICRVSSILRLHSDKHGHYWVELQHPIHSRLKVARRRYKTLKKLLRSS